jgi:8-oxo-dGTP pyrophosphatase MutT (NUDIX family)
MPLFPDSHGYGLLFTKRTSRVGSHKGQISFPGGVVDDEDKNFRETALREADEEIGLRRDDVTILGRIDDMQTKSTDFIVHPFVGLIPHPYDFKINPREVEKIVKVPLDVFFSHDSPHKREEAEFNGFIYPGTAWEYQDEVIWGATARIMVNFIAIMGDRLRVPVLPPGH